MDSVNTVSWPDGGYVGLCLRIESPPCVLKAEVGPKDSNAIYLNTWFVEVGNNQTTEVLRGPQK